MIRPRFLQDRSLVLVLLLAALVVFPRAAMIAAVHSESIDDEYHLVRGVRLLQGTLELGNKRMPLNDPPLGEAIMALPLWLMDSNPGGDGRNIFKYGLILHGQRVPVEMLLMSVAMLKSVLFVSFVVFCFAWIRRLYNERAAWAAAILLLIEPTITAHIGPAGLDVLGFAAIAVACWAWWQYFALHRGQIEAQIDAGGHGATPSPVLWSEAALEDRRRRCVAAAAELRRKTWIALIVAAVVSGAAMLIKHTAIILPAVALIYAALFCLFRRVAGESIARWLRTRWLHVVVAALVAFVSLTAFSGGFAKVPRPDFVKDGSFAAKVYGAPWPAGRYIRSLKTAMHHGQMGHSSWFMGQRNDQGSLAYYPVVALYKVPIALLVFLGVGAASLTVIRPRFEEWALVVPMLLLAFLITTGGINIGFRHAIPVLGLLLLLSTRALLINQKWMIPLAASLLAIAVIDVTRWFPNYMSYLNWPRTRVWMQINDSNLDWGQGLKQIRAWIDANGRRKIYRDRPIYVHAMGLDYSPNIKFYLGDRATKIPRDGPVPTSGILIISPIYVVGLFEKQGLYDILRDKDPLEIIGESNLVFDLDALNGKKPKRMTTKPATTTSPSPPATE